MRNFFNDGFNDDEDFMNRWNEFNRMMDDSKFNESMGKVQKDLENLLRGMMNSKDFDNINNTPIKFIITPINTGDEDFDIPKDELDVKKGKDENGEWETKNWSSPDGSVSFSSFTRSSNIGDRTDLPDDIAERWNSKLRDSRTKRTNEVSDEIKLGRYQKMLDYLVENENYEKAAEIKKLMDEIKSEKK